MKKIFFFDEMITPKIITVIYWLMLVTILISGLVAIFSTFSSYSGYNLPVVFMALGGIIGGAISTRIGCELLIVLFKINDNIKKISDK